jgi:hypothetical protein
MQTSPDTYQITANHDGTDSSDQYSHESIVEALKDMIIIGQTDYEDDEVSWMIEFFPGKDAKDQTEWMFEGHVIDQDFSDD